MLEHHVEQGSPAWFALRIGLPTASEFKKILTPAKAELSKQARTYAFKLVAETMLGRSLDDLEGLEWITRGRELEPDAVRAYEFSEGITTRQVGFITTDDGKIGASPDRLLIGAKGGLEIKVPAPQTHVGYLIDGFGDDYKPQVQGQMMVCELEFVDRYSYSPEMPFVRERTHRDEPYIQKLSAALREFCDMKEAMLEKAKAAGWFAESPKVLTPVDTAYDDLDAIVAGYGSGAVIMAG